MSAKELAFTIAGLLATFFMPWPNAWEAGADPTQAGSRSACLVAAHGAVGEAAVTLFAFHP